MRILIVGAGPIGCYLGKLLSQNKGNFEIELIEEHPEIGRPVHCAGLVSAEVMKHSRIPIDQSVILNQIDGAEFFLNGDSFQIQRQGIALVLDREKFDSFLGSGLKVHYNTRFLGIEKERREYIVETDRGEFFADIVVGADGAYSAVRRAMGLNEEIEYLRGVQFRLRYESKKDNIVGVFIKSPFFAWVIPENKQTIRVGIISSNPYHDLLKFIEEQKISGDILDKFAGIVPIGTCRSLNGGVALVGDAACQVKPLTHGGVYYGMRCAEILADCISENKLFEYEKRWQARFMREIQLGLSIRRIYQSLQDDQLRKIFLFLKRNRFMLEKFGDFENHSKVFSVILKNQQISKLFSKVLSNIFQEISF